MDYTKRLCNTTNFIARPVKITIESTVDKYHISVDDDFDPSFKRIDTHTPFLLSDFYSRDDFFFMCGRIEYGEHYIDREARNNRISDTNSFPPQNVLTYEQFTLLDSFYF